MTSARQNPHVPDPEPDRQLAERTLALVNIPSISRSEAEAMAYVRAELPLEPVLSSDDVLFATSTRRDGQPLVLLAGHVDTVPAQGNLPGRIEGDAVIRPVDADGLVFRANDSVVGVEGGTAASVVPDASVARPNSRYAPGRTREQADSYLRELIGEA